MLSLCYLFTTHTRDTPSIFIMIWAIFLFTFNEAHTTQWRLIGEFPLEMENVVPAFWDSKLYMIAGATLWSTPWNIVVNTWEDIEISQTTPLDWTNTPLPSIPGLGANSIDQSSQRYVQIENLLYGQVHSTSPYMYIFNLSSLQFRNISTYQHDLSLFKTSDFFATNETHLFVGAQKKNTIRIYDIANDEWSQSNSVFTDTQGKSGSVTRDLTTMYLFGGAVGPADKTPNDIYSYDIRNDNFTKLNVTPLRAGRFMNVQTVSDDRIFVVDGRLDYTHFPGAIFQITTQTMAQCKIGLPTYANSATIYHKPSNTLWSMGGWNAPKSVGNKTLGIRYLPVSVDLMFLNEIFNFSKTLLFATTNSSLICNDSFFFESPLLLSTNFTWNYSLFIEKSNNGVVSCHMCNSCVDCNYVLDNHTDHHLMNRTFSISTDYNHAIASICKFRLYPLNTAISYDNTLLSMTFNITNCAFTTIPSDFNLFYNVETVFSKHRINITNKDVSAFQIGNDIPFDILMNTQFDITLIKRRFYV
eukprot:35250_1